MRFIIGILAIGMVFPLSVSAQTTFSVPVSMKSYRHGEATDREPLCYRLAAEGEFIEYRSEKPKWGTSWSSEYIWKVTRLSSGLVCKVLVKGDNDLQFGPGAHLLDCQCEGQLEILK